VPHVRAPSPSLAALLASLAWLLAAPLARADDKQACIAASEDAQQLRIDGKLRAAQARLLECAKPACPAIVRQDCTQWMTEVVAATPSIVLGARDAQGHDVLAVRVSVDGTPVGDSLDGRPLPVDPGVHLFRFESATVPGLAADAQVLVRAGEKNREITVTLAAPGATPAPHGAPSRTDAAAPPTRSGVPALAWVFGGLAVASLGTALAFDVAQALEYDHLSNTCGGHCSPDQVTKVATERWIAGGALGVGVISLGVATILFVTRPAAARPPPPAVGLGFEPLPHGGFGTLVGHF
jgi:hypothetical protein